MHGTSPGENDHIFSQPRIFMVTALIHAQLYSHLAISFVTVDCN